MCNRERCGNFFSCPYILSSAMALVVMLAIIPSTACAQQKTSADSAFSKYIYDNLRYDKEALKQGVSGTVFIKFDVDNDGFIVKESVKVYQGIHPALNAEAVRVIKSYTNQLNPNSVPRGERGNFILPVDFIRHQPIEEPVNRVNPGIQSVIVPKGFATDNQEWAVYSDRNLNDRILFLSPGDTITVTGWAAWSFLVRGKDRSHGKRTMGYISYLAVASTPALAKYIQQIEARSALEETTQDTATIDRAPFTAPEAFLEISSNKKTVYQGECTIISLSIGVYETNTVPVKFTETAIDDLMTLHKNALTLPACLTSQNLLSEIEGQEINTNKGKVFSYTIHKAVYCPINDKPIQFPPIKFKMIVFSKDMSSYRMTYFWTKALTVPVTPIPAAGKSAASHDAMMSGKFTLEESSPERLLRVGECVPYEVTLSGEGMAFAMMPDILTIPGLSVSLREWEDQDSVVNDIFTTRRKFIFTVSPLKEGVYSLQDKISFRYFNTDSRTTETLSTTGILRVNAAAGKEVCRDVRKYNAYIAIDASPSMTIGDYAPNRLGVAKTGTKAFLTKRKRSDVGIFAFGNSVKEIQVNRDGKSDYRTIDSIGVRYGAPAALGDVIWTAAQLIQGGEKEKRLIIISDSENEAGTFTLELALQLAREKSIKIYTIGIGHAGPVKVVVNGEPTTTEGRFDDVHLKKIAALTGGKYFWAADAAALTKILHQILN